MSVDPPLARRDVIEGRLRHGQAVVAAALAEEFAISEDAIRRDLRALAAMGLCRRVYGGALPVSAAAPPMLARMDEGRERKDALAKVAAATIRPGEFLFLDNGSTNLALAEVLPEDHDLVVATNSVFIAAAMLKRQDLPLIMVGGSVEPSIGGCVDASALASLGFMNIDRCFLGVCAVSVAGGVSAHDVSDAAFKRALLAASRHSVVMATTDKLATHAPHRIAALDAIGCLVIDADAPAAEVEALVRAGAPVRQAGAAS